MKFKKGDKVRVISRLISRPMWHKYDDGVWTIKEVRANRLYPYVLSPDTPSLNSWRDEELELAEDKKQTPCEKLGYKVGDLFVCTADGSQCVTGDVLKLDDDDGSDMPMFINLTTGSEFACSSLKDVKPLTPKDITTTQVHNNFDNNNNESKKGFIMSTLSKVRELALSKEVKLRRKYEVVDECGKRTTEGTEILLDLLFQENLEKIDAKLVKVEAEEKKNK